jgi:hypothetical protein
MGYQRNLVTGAVKSGAQVLGTILDLVSSPGPLADLDPNKTNVNPKATAHIKDAADWLRSGTEPKGFLENVGAIGEQVLEYMGGGELLRLVGPARAVAGAARAVETGEHLKQAQQVATVLKNNPKIAGLVSIGLKASKDALVQGGQTYLHTEDPTQAAIAGGIGGGVGALAEGAGAAGRYLQKISPKSVNIAGEEVPALVSQIGESGRPTGTGAEGAPVIQRGQQAGTPKAIRTLAQRATKNVLDRLNLSRPVVPEAITDPSRMLAAPEGGAAGSAYAYDTQGRMSIGAAPGEAGQSRPFFTMDITPPAEEASGQVAHEAAKFEPSATNVPEGGTAGPQTGEQLGTTARTVPERMQQRTQAYTGAIAESPREPGTGREGPSGAEPTQTEPRVERTNTGQLGTNNPQEAQAWLRHLEDMQATSDYKNLSDAQRATIEAQRKALQEQLSLYHASPYVSRFAPIDSAGVAGNVATFGNAADQIQASVEPVFQTLDKASNGQFTALRETAKKAKAVMQNPGSMESFDAANARYKEATSTINSLITSHADAISREDYIAAKQAWKSSVRLDELHTVFERMMNGVTAEETATQGLPRFMKKGNTEALEKWLAGGTNRSQAEELLGKEGVANLKDITLLMSNANSNRSLQTILKNVATELGSHARLGGLGGAVGSMMAHQLGYSWFGGAWAGGMTAAAMRLILRDAATNPRIGNMVTWAAKNGLSPQHYAPLIARAIAEPLQEQPKPQQGNRQTSQQGSNREQETDEEHGTAYDTGPRAGKPVEGMIRGGNIDVNHRPEVTNADGTHSTIFSVTVPLDREGNAVSWESPAIANYALVPGIVNGRFLTPNGKKPVGKDANGALEDRAAENYQHTRQHLGIFKSAEAASKYAGETHAYMPDGTARKVFTPSGEQGTK